MDGPELDRDPVRELSAEFAPNEVALALTLTQFAAEWWMSLAVSLSRQAARDVVRAEPGLIHLGRAKLIDAWTTPLDDDLAGAVERKVPAGAGPDRPDAGGRNAWSRCSPSSTRVDLGRGEPASRRSGPAGGSPPGSPGARTRFVPTPRVPRRVKRSWPSRRPPE